MGGDGETHYVIEGLKDYSLYYIMNIANPHMKKYYLSHQEEIAQAKQNYQVRHPEVFKANSKKYYDKNKDIIIGCPCGSEISAMGMWCHKKTKKHLAFLAKTIVTDDGVFTSYS